MIDPQHGQVTFENGVLTVGGTRLAQFADYKVSTFFDGPKWPATTSVTIEAKDDRPNRAVVSASLFDENLRQGWTPERLQQEPEQAMFGTRDVRTLVDETMHVAGRECRYRVKDGVIDDRGTPSTTGVVIARGGTRPFVGISVDGINADEVQGLTVDMARALCAGEPSGA